MMMHRFGFILIRRKFVAFMLSMFGLAAVFALISRAELVDGNVNSTDNVQSVDRSLQYAMELNSKGQYTESIELLLKSLKANPNANILRQLLRQTVFLQVKDKVEAGIRKISKNPHDTLAYLEIANAFHLVEQRQKALEILLQGIEQNPNATDLWEAIGQLELEANRLNEALAIFREITRINPKESQAHFAVAYLILSDSKISKMRAKEALQHAQEALALEPANKDYRQLMIQINDRFNKSRPTDNL